MEITANTTNDLAPLAYRYLRDHGLTMDSRNGPVLVAPEPVTIQLRQPWLRVNFCPVRDANPFFHLMEAMAMLAGANDARWLSLFARRMMDFSDDGRTFNAFYGTRLRCGTGDCQLTAAGKHLLANPDSRQEVALLWRRGDLTNPTTKDKACNLVLVFQVRAGALCMYSFNRSNDAILGGVTGANVVHLSLFHEYVAAVAGFPMGSWWHTSANLHVYVNDPHWPGLSAGAYAALDRYTEAGVCEGLQRLLPGTDTSEDFRVGLHRWIGWALAHGMSARVVTGSDMAAVRTFWKDLNWRACAFLAETVMPMYAAHRDWRNHNIDAALAQVDNIRSLDWRLAARAWMQRRLDHHAKGSSTTYYDEPKPSNVPTAN